MKAHVAVKTGLIAVVTVLGVAAGSASAGDYCQPHCQKIWCPPVYETVCRKVWCEPVYQTVCRKVYHEPIYETVCRKVWCPPVTCEKPYAYYDHCGRCCTGYRTVVVTPGYYKDVHEQVLVKDGWYETLHEQVLVKPGFYKTVHEQVLVKAGHWITRCY